MDLISFTKKFLPNYDVRLSNYKVSYFRDNPVGFEKRGRLLFCELNFTETLDNFTKSIGETKDGQWIDLYDKNKHLPKKTPENTLLVAKTESGKVISGIAIFECRETITHWRIIK
jgi:hypothetical protein